MIDTRDYQEYRSQAVFAVVTPWLRALCGSALRGVRIADFGCHDGTISIALAQEGAEVVGLDVRPSHIASARRRAQDAGLTNVSFVCANIVDATGLDLGDFDVVLLFGVLYHLSDPIGVTRTIAELCKRALFIDSHVHISASTHKEDIASWWMLSDSDWPSLHGVSMSEARSNSSHLLGAQAEHPVDYSQLQDRFLPSPHTLRDIAVSQALAPPPADTISEDVCGADPGALSLIPNRKAIVDLLRACGFPFIAELQPLRFAPTPYLLRHRATFAALRDPGDVSVVHRVEG